MEHKSTNNASSGALLTFEVPHSGVHSPKISRKMIPTLGRFTNTRDDKNPFSLLK